MPAHSDFQALPKGAYLVEILKVKIRDPDSPNATLEFTLRVVEGPYADRRLWMKLRIWDRRSGVAAFARAAVGAICAAVEVEIPCDWDDVLHIPFLVDVSVKSWRGRFINVVSGYRSAPPDAPRRTAGDRLDALERPGDPHSADNVSPCAAAPRLATEAKTATKRKDKYVRPQLNDTPPENRR